MATALAVLRLVASRPGVRAVAASAVAVTATDNSIRTTKRKCAILVKVAGNGRLCLEMTADEAARLVHVCCLTVQHSITV